MSSIENRKIQQEQEKNKEDFIASLVDNFRRDESTKATRTVDAPIGEINISTGKIPIFRTDHYLGRTENIQQGLYQYSTYTAVIAGVRISNDKYQKLLEILRLL